MFYWFSYDSVTSEMENIEGLNPAFASYFLSVQLAIIIEVY